MTKLALEALEALKDSIAHWERIVVGEDHCIGTADCSLCRLFWDGCCACCPVFEKTGQTVCRGTPHAALDSHRDTAHGECAQIYTELCPKCKELAEEEVKFLKSLLPKAQKEI